MKKIIIVCLLISSLSSWAKLKVKNVSLATRGTSAILTIYLNGMLQQDPELSIRDNILQVALPNGVVWPKIEKRVSLYKGKRKETTIIAYQFDKTMARVRTLLPYKLTNVADIDLRVKDNKIVATFPILKSTKSVKKQFSHVKSKKSAKKYDESFLDKLLQEQTKVDTPKEHSTLKTLQKNVVVEDKVKAKVAAVDKAPLLLDAPKKKFDLMSYFGKFVAFLGVILLLFYGVVYLMRKGVLKKGKLGFLNDTNIITVLNTTYIAPKKSLMLVRVHQQTFLLSSTEKGIEFLSEVNDTTGLLKEGEKEVAGNNFDTTLGVEKMSEQQDVVLKKDITKSQPLEEGNAILNALKKSSKDQVSFSEQIKNRVKNLKPLQ